MNRRAKDLRGQRFGKFSVKELAQVGGATGKHAHWVCICDCGNDRITRGTDLVRGKKTACESCTRLSAIEKRRLEADTAGIYLVMNNFENVFYIGQTTRLRRRESEHRYAFRTGAFGRANGILAAAWKKHGPDSFEFVVLELCEASKLIEREAYWIDLYRNKYPGCVANADGPNDNPMKGSTHSESAREKMSDALRGRKMSPEQLASHIDRMTGRKVSEATKEKIRGGKNPSSRAIVCIEAGKQFQTCSEAAQWLRLTGRESVDLSTLCKAGKGLKKTAYGYTWRYLTEMANV